ncbi:MAG: hypothetical protein BGO32_09895 [Bacteroidetes bacterium 37-13]|nr:MAG: hypothetical protein BGO32_09895 [Bacteroidetes bacterium 37-13]
MNAHGEFFCAILDILKGKCFRIEYYFSQVFLKRNKLSVQTFKIPKVLFATCFTICYLRPFKQKNS